MSSKDGNSSISVQMESSAENDDIKYLTGLSTILVATIQEVKDRISNVEFIFCSQIFPLFQSKSRDWKIKLDDVKKVAEDGWKMKESSLQKQLEALQIENCNAGQQIKHLTASLIEANLLKEKLVSDAQENESKQLAQLQEQLSVKIEEAEKGREFQEQLMHQLDLKNSEILDMQKNQKDDFQMRKMLVELQEQLRLKTEEVEKEKECQHQLQKQIDLNNAEILDLYKMKEVDSPAKQLMDGLQKHLRSMMKEVDNEKELNQQLLSQIDMQNSEIMAVQEKKRNAINMLTELKRRYTILSHQYNHLLSKVCHTPRNEIPHQNGKAEKDLKHDVRSEKNVESSSSSSSPTSHPSYTKVGDKKKVESDLNKVSDGEILNVLGAGSEGQIIGMVDDETQIYVDSPQVNQNYKHASSALAGGKCPGAGNSKPLEECNLRSSWRVTRQEGPLGADPHDDFLDTPMEDVRRNISKGENTKISGASVSENENKNLNFETASRKRQASTPYVENRGFKFVEPVRKKADRVNLKGVECKQCKKFYDAVLPDGGGNKNSEIRCEHHEGVSRHRYKYIPPMTPEGFWNIGFDSDM